MEFEEHGHENGNDSVQHVGNLDDNVCHERILVLLLCGEVVGVETPLDRIEPGKGHAHSHDVGYYKHVNEEENEEFAIPEADAVVDPGTVVVHVEHTPIARLAMMAPLRLENVAHQTVTTSFNFRIAHVESPKDGNLAGFHSHGLVEGPDHHDEEEVEDAEEKKHAPIVFQFGQPNQEGVSVVDYCDDPSHENHEDVPEDYLRAYGQAARHSVCC